MPDGTQLYCLGLPLRGIRQLAGDELVELRRRVTTSIQRRRYERLLRTGLGIVAGLAAVTFAVLWPDEDSVGLTVGAALGVFAAALVPGTVIYGFVFPRIRGERLLFGLASVAVITLAVWSKMLPDWAVGVLSFAVMGAGLFGIPIWLLRGLEARRTAPAFAALPLDAQSGEVLVFEAPTDSKPAEDSQAESRFEVLPHSRLLYKPGVKASWDWERVPIDEVAAPPVSPREWVPQAGEERWVDDDEYWYRRRKLLVSEIDELRRMVRRVPKQAMLELIGVIIGAVVLTQAVQYILWGLDTVLGVQLLETQVSSAAWVAVLLIALGRSIRLTREWRAWRADLRCGEVLRARPAGKSPLSAEVVVEILPESGVIWTEAGQPAAWRGTAQ